MRSPSIHALVVLIAGLLLGIGALLSGAFLQEGGALPGIVVQGTATRPLLACGQITISPQGGQVPCAFQQPQTPPAPNQLGACDVQADCDSLRELLGAWTTALAVLVGSLGTLWVVQGCVAALRPGHQDSVWDSLLQRLLGVGVAFYIAWRVDDFAQFVVALLVAHKGDHPQSLDGLGVLVTDASPPSTLLGVFVGDLLVMLSQCFFIFLLPRVLFQAVASIGSLLWVPERDTGRAGRRAFIDLLRLLGLAAWELLAPAIAGGIINLLAGKLTA